MKDKKNIRKNKKNFIWGVTQVGQQVEGGCCSNNWSTWARRGLVPKCGIANDYWNKFRKDHDLLEELNVSAYRISIDWGRIEVFEGQYEKEVITHYRSILLDIKNRNIKVVLGLWHYTVPDWLEQNYGMEDSRVVQKFLNFVKVVLDELGDLVDMVIVLNEPMVYIGTSFLLGERPPFKKNPLLAIKVLRNLINFHKLSYKLWKEKYNDIPVGTAHLWNDLGRVHNTFMEKIAVKVSQMFRVDYLIRKLDSTSDFLGINYYTSDKLKFDGFSNKKDNKFFAFCGTANWPDPDVWKVFPEGLYRVLLKSKKYNKPIYVLENGKPTDLGSDDKNRQQFLIDTIGYVEKAIDEGVDVRGYFHYSLIDAYEWTSGYDFRFGLVEIDRKTLKRHKRNSFFVYKNIIKDSEL